MNPLSTDICVVGAGPAGTMLAGLLATAGRDVILVGPQRSQPPTAVQSLAPAAMTLLRDEQVDLAGICETVPIDVTWPSNNISIDESPTTTLIDRPQFETALRGWAATRGVRFVNDRLVEHPRRTDDPSHWSLHTSDLTIDAMSVVNAAGARSVFATRRIPTGPSLFGLSATSSAHHDQRGVWIEATDRGWIWAASKGDGVMHLLTTHDHAPKRRDARATMCRMIGRSVLATYLGDDPLTRDDIRPMDCTPTLAEANSQIASVGDAALTIDPLAGQGLAVALRSAAQLADLMTTHTPLVRSPADVSRTHARLAAAYYEQADRFFDTPFWRRHR